MKKIIALLICLMLVLSTTGCGLLPFLALKGLEKNDEEQQIEHVEELEEANEAFLSFMEEEFIDTAESDTLTLHYTLADPESSGAERPEVTYGSGYRLEDYEETREELEDFLRKLDEFDASELSEDNARRLEFLRMYAENKLALTKYPQLDMLMDAQYGVAVNLPSTLASYKFYCERDIEDYLELLRLLPELFDSCMEFERGKDEEYRMAQFTVDNTVEQIDVFLEGRGDALIDTFEERIAAANYLTPEQARKYIDENDRLINEVVLGAYEKLRSDLKSFDTGGRDKGLCYYEGGEEYYAELLKSMTYSQKTPEEMADALFERYDELVERITAMQETYGSAAFDVFGSLEGGGLPAKEMLEGLREDSADDYPELSHISYSVEEIPEVLRQENTLAYYVLAPLDADTDNEIFYKPDERDAASFFMTLAHEGYPGHMYQWNYLIENGEPRLLMSLDTTGLMEGWAVYVEIDSLNYLDCGENDAKQIREAYSIDLELNYLICSLADILVNYYGYDRDALTQMLSQMGLDDEAAGELYESSVDTPGLYPRYYISSLELLTLREEAEERLGAAFDALAFNRAVLDTGICYFSQLAEELEEHEFRYDAAA